MNWSERQQKAIDVRGKDLLVSAAAGSGKTAVLVERVRKLVLEEDVSLDRMLIVTFTNAAASEMKQRIYASLEGQLAAGGLSRERQRRIREQIGLVGRANISTFHKFALEIVHRYYHIIGIKPNMGICDEARQSMLSREAMDEMMDARYAEPDPGFLAFLDCYAGSGGDGPVRDMILELHRFLQSLPYPDEWTKELAEEQSGKEELYLDFAEAQSARRFSLALACFSRVGGILEESGLLRLRDKNEADAEYVRGLLSVLEEQGSDAARALIEGHRYSVMSATKEENASWEMCREEVSSLRDSAKKHVSQAAEHFLCANREKLEKEREMFLPFLRTLIGLTEDFSERYGAKKALLGLLDFSDIEHFALRILGDPGVCSEYREKFDHVFVDEYQDSNMVQESLIEKIARRGSVFRVGDVKQSIYKFRLAEPELFLARSSRGKEEDGLSEVIDLNSNYRSKRSVIDLVNSVFGLLMTKASAGMDYTRDDALVQGSPYAGPLDYSPEFYLIDTGGSARTAAPLDARAPREGAEAAKYAGEAKGEGSEAADVVAEESIEETDAEIAELRASELEALNAAEIIRKYRAKPIWDDKLRAERPLEYRDMAILMRSAKNDAEVFYKTLADAGIPVFLDRSEGYFDAVEIQVFLNLLRVIDNRSRDIPLLSVLRSPVFGFCASDLAEVRIWAKEREETRAPYARIFAEYANEGPCGELRERCAAFMEKIAGWKDRAKHEPLGDFIWDLLFDTGYGAFASALPAGPQRLANLRALADRAERYEAENAGGLYGFISYIDSINSRGGKVETGQVKIMSEGEDAVRIMTVHKSKGLEFPFVLLAGLGKRLSGGRSAARAEFHKSFGAALRLVNPKTGVYSDPVRLDFIRRVKASEEMAESIRILYVALPRAKDIAVMSAAVRNADRFAERARASVPGDMESCSSYAQALLCVLPPSHIRRVFGSSLAAGAAAADTRRDGLAERLEKGFRVAEEELPVPREEIRRRLDFDYGPAGEDLQKRKYSVSQIADMERLKLNRLPRVLSAEGGAGFSAPEGFFPEKEPEYGEYGSGRETDMPAFMAGERRPDAAAKGRAYHSVMEHIPFTKEGKSKEEIKAFIASLSDRGIIAAEDAAAVDPEKIAAFFASGTGREALLAYQEGALRRETPFTLRRELNGRQVLVQGTVDCWFVQGDGIVLLDYKSNYVDVYKEAEETARLREEYLPQLALYREALGKAFGLPVKKAVLYLFGTGKEISIDD